MKENLLWGTCKIMILLKLSVSSHNTTQWLLSIDLCHYPFGNTIMFRLKQMRVSHWENKDKITFITVGNTEKFDTSASE